ncbi:hypothetical protein [Natronorubrum halophilum]|uniref:hypothetical protein n=1 Tax=Natronorubrum halophilum TaxID=1702106 RepID=UPI000EF6B767|nr:hypothetical protein [Natronorubrum halophilum]
MAGPDSERDGIREGLESSRGDPRVLVALNVVLSTMFAVMLVWGLFLVGALEFSVVTVAVVAVVLFVLTYVLT